MIRRKTAIVVLGSFAAAFAASAGQPDVVFTDGFELTESVGPDCSFVDPAYPPTGYRRTGSHTLEELWLDTTGTTIGSRPATVRLALTGEYSTFRFDRSMLPSAFYSIAGDTANVGFALAPARSRYLTVTSCPGDLRYAYEGGGEPGSDECRRFGGEGFFLYLNWGPPIAGVCNLDPTRTYYLNVIFDDPRDGYSATEPCTLKPDSYFCGFRISAYD